jgi:hypothetical protein
MMKQIRKPNSPGTAIRSLLVGGLGNQLFGYFAGLYLSRHLNVDFIPHIAKRRAGETHHPFGISSLDLAKPLFREPSLKFRVILFLRRLKRRLLRLVGFSQITAERYSKLHSATQIGSDPDLLSVKKGSIIEGYFQTYKYFSKVKDQNLQKLKLKNPSSWFDTRKLEIVKDNPIVLHVRRGDYADPKNKSFGVLTPDYFRKALESGSFQASDLSRPLWIFSDDIENVKTEFKFIKSMNVHFVKAPDNSDPAESLILMSLASSIIISNSTFSWWAATLSSGAKIVAPSKWFKDMDDPEDLIPDHWIRIDSQWY